MSYSKILVALLPAGFLVIASAFKAFYPPPTIVGVEKTACKVTMPGKTIKKEVHLNLLGANLVDFNGQKFYYYFFDDTNTLIEIAEKTVGPNPQIVPVTALKNGVTYGVEPFAVKPVGPLSGTSWDQFFTAQFDCIKKTSLPKGNSSSSSTGAGGANRKN